MAYKFNPFTDTLDLVGSSDSYIDGEVEYHSNLPVTVGTPAVNSAFLVRKGEGLYFISRKPAGIWVRELNNGNLDDWKFAGLFSDLYRDANFRIISDSDTSKELAFSLSGITTGTTRTLTAPDASGTIARTEDFAAPPAIGNTTPNTGAFTTLSANNGTLTASAPVLDLSQTWNNAAVTFTGILATFTNTASNAASRLIDLRVGADSFFSVNRSGTITGVVASGGTLLTSSGSGAFDINASGGARIRFAPSGVGGPLLLWSGTGKYQFFPSAATANTSLGLFVSTEGTNNVMALENAANPQTFRIYNTYTDASNHERGFMRWSSNVLQIGTEKAGTGSARTIGINVGSIEAIAIATNGEVTVRSRIYISTGSKDVAYTGLGSHAFPSVGTFSIRPWSGSACRINIGGDTSSFPALKRDSTAIHVRLADDSAFAPLSCGALTLNGNLDASTRDLVTDTTTGTKIGTATTQKLGFFNATPVVQQAAVADATDAATAITQLNDLLAAMRTLGLIAT
jgi:hypothetical protein